MGGDDDPVGHDPVGHGREADPEDWPAWATEQVHVAEPDPGWATAGEQLGARVADLLTPWLCGPVEHVGSTAVPGLAAKPVLDLQAPVTDLDAAAAALASTGRGNGTWHLVPPDLDGRPERRFLVLVVADARAAHLHAFAAGDPHLLRMRRFRDALRADAGLAARYASLKRDLAAAHGADRQAYSAAKREFVEAAQDLSCDGAG